MKTLTGWMVAGLLLPAAVAGEECETDSTFAEEGWAVHRAEAFDQVLQTALRRIEGEEGLEYASTLPVFNEELDRFLTLIAFDQVETSDDTMIDDLVVFVDEETQGVYEVRWFDGGQRHVAYDSISCANPPVPRAYNSMW